MPINETFFTVLVQIIRIQLLQLNKALASGNYAHYTLLVAIFCFKIKKKKIGMMCAVKLPLCLANCIIHKCIYHSADGIRI